MRNVIRTYTFLIINMTPCFWR